MTDGTKQILVRLDEIKSELDYIKERLVDVDMLITEDDIASLEEAEQDLREGKTTRLN